MIGDVMVWVAFSMPPTTPRARRPLSRPGEPDQFDDPVQTLFQ